MLVWPERSFVPLWDANVYLQCVVDAGAYGLTVESLRCGGHHAQLYTGLLAMTQLWQPGNLTALIVANLILAAGALAAFYAVLRRLIPGEGWWLDRALLVTILAVHPLAAATLVQLNLDFGVCVFFAITLAALVWDRHRVAALAGLFLCFSKETGVLVYAATITLHLVFRVFAGSGPAFARCWGAIRRAAPIMLPLAVYVSFLAWWAVTHDSSVIWIRDTQERPLSGMRWFDFDDVVLRSYLAIILVLGFAWVPALVIATDFARGALRMLRRLEDRSPAGVNVNLAWFLASLTAVLMYLLTVYRTWSFPRYFAILAPLLILTAFVSLVRLGVPPRARRLGLAALGLVLLSANWWSWDPVSQRLFGTVDLGASGVYDVSSIARDFRPLGTDHFCYNLQFTAFHYALNAAFAAVRPGETTTIVFPRFNRWGLWAPLDARTFARVATRTNSFLPRYADETQIAAMRDSRPHELWLIEQPNDADTLARQALHRAYVDAGLARYTERGLSVTVRHLVRRDTRMSTFPPAIPTEPPPPRFTVKRHD